MRHPCSDNRAAQFMFASPRRAKHVRTSSCTKALARMSYTRGLASFFIVATPASNCLLNREHITADGETPSRDGTTHLMMSPLELMWRRAVLVPRSHPPVNEPVLIGASALERAVRRHCSLALALRIRRRLNGIPTPSAITAPKITASIRTSSFGA